MVTTRLKCIDSQIGKALTKEQADNIQTEINRYAKQNGVTLVEAAKAKIETAKQYQAARKKQAAFQALRNRVIIDTIMKPSVLPETKWSKAWDKITFGATKLQDSDRAALALLVPDISERTTQRNVEHDIMGLTGEFNSILAEHKITFDDMDKLKNNQQTADDVYRELAILSGINIPKTDNAVAAKIAKAVYTANEHFKMRYRKVGGVFLELEDWVLPHRHNRDSLKAVGKDKWIETVKPLLDRKRMTDFETDNTFDTSGLSPDDAKKVDARFDELLGEVWENAVYGKLSNLEAYKGKSKLANRLDKHRVLHFTPENWIKYQHMFGEKMDQSIIQHFDNLARDIGLMGTLGPNPDVGIQVIKNAVENKNKLNHGNRSDIKRTHQMIDNFYDILTGRNRIPVWDNLGGVMQSVRSLQTSAQLGSAALLSLGDFATAKMAASWNDIPFARVLDNYFHNLRSRDAREEAALAGAATSNLFSNQQSITRQIGDFTDKGTSLTKKISTLAHWTLKATGLDQHTVSLVLSFGNGMAMEGSNIARTTLDKMDPHWKRFSETYGLEQKHWDIINQSRRVKINGHDSLSKMNIIRVNDKLALEAADRLFSGISHESQHAVMMTSANTEQFLLGKTRPGTGMGEFRRSVAMYKRYPVMFMMTNLARTLFNPKMVEGERGRRIASTVIYFTLAGAIGINLREIASGRDPLDMTDPENWGRAFIAGGGAGPILDLMAMTVGSNDKSYVRESLEDYFLGPPISLGITLASDLGHIATDVGNVDKLRKDFGDLVFTDIKRNLLPGSSIFYIKTALDRAFFDQIQSMVDPSFKKRKADSARRLLKEQGKQYFAPPGADLSDIRAPDFGRIIGNP